MIWKNHQAAGPDMYHIRQIRRGLGYLEGYGHHPGIHIAVILIVFGTVMGALCDQPITGFLLNTAVWGTLLLFGAYDRAVHYDAWKKKETHQ